MKEPHERRKKPLKIPMTVITMSVHDRRGPITADDKTLSIRPNATIGSRPYSTFAPDSLPASRHPTPIPTPSAASGMPVCQSFSPNCFAS